MTQRQRVYAAITMLIALCVSAAIGRADNAAKLANVKTIGVVSALGDTLYNVRIGSTAFTNARSTVEVADWKLDEFVITEAAAQLAGRFATNPVTYDRADFTPAPSEWRGHSELDVEEVMGRAKPADGAAIDAYLVLHNIVLGDVFALTNQNFYAAGLHHRVGLFGDTMDGIFIAAMLTLVDARTGKKIDSSVFVIPGGESLFVNFTPAHRVLKEPPWDENFVMTPEQRDRAQAEFKSLISEALTRSLRRIDLLPDK